MPRFETYESPGRALWDELVALAPGNPFHTPAYAEARAALGWRPWIVAVRGERGLLSGCPAFVKSGYLSKLVELPSLPSNTPPTFWEGLLVWCRRQRASRLEVNSFGSQGCDIPALAAEQGRRRRCEYVWDLDGDGPAGLSTNHARNIKRGRNANLSLRQSGDVAGCEHHVDLMALSMDRRRDRGESVTAARQVQLTEASALVRHGAGRFFQAIAGGTPLSSVLVLLADDGAYYHSAGTAPEGMKVGASHWLIHEIAGVLRASGRRGFNLGGVSERGSGLEQFKSGFGARRVDLETVTVVTEGGMRRWLGAGARLLRGAATPRLVR
jgi:hypothetical protein